LRSWGFHDLSLYDLNVATLGNLFLFTRLDVAKYSFKASEQRLLLLGRSVAKGVLDSPEQRRPLLLVPAQVQPNKEDRRHKYRHRKGSVGQPTAVFGIEPSARNLASETTSLEKGGLSAILWDLDSPRDLALAKAACEEQTV